MKKINALAYAAFYLAAGAAEASEDFQRVAVKYGATPWLRSTINSWGKTPLVAARIEKPKGVTYVAYVNVPHGQHSFKVDTSVEGDWSTNFGDKNPSDPCMDSEGGNIAFDQGAGTYEVRFSGGLIDHDCARPYYALKKLNDFSSIYRSMYLRLSLSNWALLPMALVKNHVWEAPVSIAPNTPALMKFDANGDWNVNFGRPKSADARLYRNAGVAGAQDGENLELQVEGSPEIESLTVLVRFDERSKEFAVCPNISKAVCQ